jgi:hypothetical protein
MDNSELAEYIENNIPTFINIRVIDEGVAYHYTNHSEAILNSEGFKGHIIDNNLDQTQLTIISKPATDSEGVVFGYQKIEDAIEEGVDCDVFEIKFSKAVIASHSQEATLGAPDTVLILCNDIISFQKMEI